MAKSITKKNWASRFNLIGTPKIGDYTFKIDEKSAKSDWIYNSMNLGVDCGEMHGIVYAEMMGGYGENRDNVIYVHGKDADGRDDFDNRFTVAWEDRFDDSILESIGDLSFITVGLEKTTKGKTYYKKFLSEYDAIAYIQENLTSDSVVNVKGQLNYSMYNDNVQVRKRINSIVLSSVDDASKYAARFTQSILLDEDSASLKKVDKDKGVMYIDARVLDYMSEYEGIEVKGQFPFRKQFEFEIDLTNQAQCKKIMDKVFKVKKGITQITFDGVFVEGGATITATIDDVPEDIKELIDCGVYTEEEALAACSSNGSRERRMVLKKPVTNMTGEGDEKVPVLQKFEERYAEEDLILDCLDEKPPFDADDDSSSSDADNMDWLNDL